MGTEKAIQQLPLDLGDIKLVIFDLDGTLYNQGSLRKKMLFELLRYYAFKPHKWGDLRIIQAFRKEREKHADFNQDGLDQAQYEWCAAATGASVDYIRQLIERWMMRAPLKHLASRVIPGSQALLNWFSANGIQTAVYSDFPAKEKMAAMGLRVDRIISSTDPEIDRLKPNPKGLQILSTHFKLPAQACLFVGDRDERDGEAARRANMWYYIIDPKIENFTGYYPLLEQFKQTYIAKPQT